MNILDNYWSINLIQLELVIESNENLKPVNIICQTVFICATLI